MAATRGWSRRELADGGDESARLEAQVSGETGKLRLAFFGYRVMVQ